MSKMSPFERVVPGETVSMRRWLPLAGHGRAPALLGCGTVSSAVIGSFLKPPNTQHEKRYASKLK